MFQAYIQILILVKDLLELIKANRVKPSPQTLTCLLETVLRLNNFTFNDEHFIQILILVKDLLELIKANRVKPSPQTLTCLLETVLRLNNFTFNDEHFIQIKGTAMGARVAPNF